MKIISYCFKSNNTHTHTHLKRRKKEFRTPGIIVPVKKVQFLSLTMSFIGANTWLGYPRATTRIWNRTMQHDQGVSEHFGCDRHYTELEMQG